jgi:hypothetical protein
MACPKKSCLFPTEFPVTHASPVALRSRHAAPYWIAQGSWFPSRFFTHHMGKGSGYLWISMVIYHQISSDIIRYHQVSSDIIRYPKISADHVFRAFLSKSKTQRLVKSLMFAGAIPHSHPQPTVSCNLLVVCYRLENTEP